MVLCIGIIQAHPTSLKIKLFLKIRRKLGKSVKNRPCGPPFGFFRVNIFSEVFFLGTLMTSNISTGVFIDAVFHFCMLIDVTGHSKHFMGNRFLL